MLSVYRYGFSDDVQMTCDHCPGAVRMVYTIDRKGDVEVHWLCEACGRTKQYTPEYVPFDKIQEVVKQNAEKYSEEWF